MAVSAVFHRRRWPEKVDGFDLSRSEGDEAHVLAVDDSLVDRKVIEKLLKISSCKVTAVDSGRRALEFLGIDEEDQNITAMEELKIDLIITDYCMPGMTGYDLLKKIKESSAFRDVPVVIMSSENVLTRIHRCLEEGAEDFIVKPVKLSDVKRLKDQLMSVSKIKTATDGPDLSTSSESPPSISSPESSPSPASTASPPSSPTASLEPLDSPSRSAKPLLAVDQIIPDSASLEPLDSPSRSAKPLSAVDQIIPDSPL